jgi:uncharacterized membrane protein
VLVAVAALAVAAMSHGAVRLRLEASAACDVGVNAGAAGLGVIEGGAVLLLVNLTAVVALSVVRSRLLATGVLAVVLACSCWVFLATTWPPIGYPSPVRICVDNVPDWWPGWLAPR